MMAKLFRFPGGLELPSRKRRPTSRPLATAPLPQRLYLPLRQHIGQDPEPQVSVGDRVLKGQVIARPGARISAPIHAPSSGTIADIGEYPISHPSGLKAPCIVIETDGRDEWIEHRGIEDYRRLTPEQLRGTIREAGIVGMGGAGFPSFIKLSPTDSKPVETLIINAAECEPYISCDEMLIRERADQVVAGVAVMLHALQAQRGLIGIEDNKPLAIERLEQAIAAAGLNNIEVVAVPTMYPAGGEKQLIQILTGREVPSGGFPIEIGVVCHNVGTAYAVNRAVRHGEPLISRLLTVAGAVEDSRNLEALFGTPVDALINHCGGDAAHLEQIVIGGPMMGYAVHDRSVPVVKTTNCILAGGAAAESPDPARQATALPCIRCGACADACPAGLLPQQLYWYARAKDFDRVQDHHLFDCIECGCCDYVCPSHIPLVQFFRFAKTEIWQMEREKQLADISRQRHEFHKERLEREKREREARQKKHRHAVDKDKPDDDKKAAIQAALERAKAKRAASGVTPKNTANLTPEQQRQIDEADARRARLKQSSPQDSDS